MGDAFTGAGTDLIDILFGLYAMLVMLRFILQAVRADFYNPLSQAVVQLTDPPLRPLRALIPGYGGQDIASLVLCFLVIGIGKLLTTTLAGFTIPIVLLLVISIQELVLLLLRIYMWSFLIMVVISWVAPGSGHPAAFLLYQITEPVLAPIRRFIPPVGGLDFSVMVALLAIYMLTNHFVPALFMALAQNLA